MPQTRRPREIAHQDGRAVALPLGGIGTGNLAIGADGGLRQWQLHNTGNHAGTLPETFFSVRACRVEPPVDELRVLQAPVPPADAPLAPLVDDAVVPAWQRRLLDVAPGVQGSTFRGHYPFAEVDLHDDALPVSVSVEAFTPLTPLDVDESALPVAMFTVSVTAGDDAVHGWVGTTLQNAVGGDGVTPPDGNRCALYGGNTNRVRRADGWTSLVMEAPGLAPEHPGAGQMVLSAEHPDAPALAQFAAAEEFLAFLRGRNPLVRAGRGAVVPHHADHQVTPVGQATGPSPAGSTWNGGIAVPFHLEPGETRRVRVAMTWHFPNRYVDFEQFGPSHPERAGTRFFLGNAYTRRWVDAVAVAEHVQRDWDGLRERSAAWSETLLGSSLPLDVAERMAAQASLVRSPTCFQTVDDRFFGFEGVLGRSTGMWNGDHGGSCPLNCTHVWNYEQAMSRLFPTLERSMRETDLYVAQAPDGAIPHRVIVPTWLPQLWDVPIGGPFDPALDGMLGTVLKVLREVRQGAGHGWLEEAWLRVVRLLDHVREHWDPDGTGLLRGIQPSTHDIDLGGVNTFMGTYWLAALRAAEELARLVGDGRGGELRALFERGSTAYHETCWNGSYYEQVLDPDEPTDFQWGRGCLSDQVIGQWWAHQLELGHLLPAEHVRTALASVVEHNWRDGFAGFEHGFRTYADGDDAGLVMVTWPTGGRPDVPTRYADEVWSGIEQQVGAHCLQEGLPEPGMRVLRALWARHDGRRRNPYNEIECGDHYARAMSGWSVLEALTGQRWDAVTGTLRLGPPAPDASGPWRVPVLLDQGWGTAELDGDRIRLACRHGRLGVRRLVLDVPGWSAIEVADDVVACDVLELSRAGG